MSKTSVVIVTYNGARWIRRNLQSLKDCMPAARVIVVDNASTDETAEIVAKEFPEVALLVQPGNSGFGVANNIGIAYSIKLGCDYVFLLNQDAYVTDGAIDQLEDFMDSNEQCGVVTPLHLSPDVDSVDRKTYLGYLQTYASEFLCDAALGKPGRYYKIRGINAAAWFVRASVFLKTGGFDPIFFMYGEDDDMISRFERHGISFALYPESRIVHLRETSSAGGKKGLVARIRAQAKKKRGGFIVLVKNADYSYFHMAIKLAAHGLVIPFGNFIVDRNAEEFLSTVLAALKVLSELRSIRRHAAICAIQGPHFLGLEASELGKSA